MVTDMSMPKSVKGFGSIHHAMHVSYNEGIRKENPYSPRVREEVTKERILAMLEKSLETFINDPPDNDFQKGYMNALEDVRKAINANHYQD